MNRRNLFLTISLVLIVHVAVLSLIALRPAKEVVPRRNLPYLPPPEPPNFAFREFTYTDPETGGRVTETRFVVSTKLFTGEEKSSTRETSAP